MPRRISKKRRSGLICLTDDAQQRNHGKQRREKRQHSVVGQSGSEVGALIPAELPQSPPRDVFPERLGDIPGPLQFTAVIGFPEHAAP